MDQTRSLESRTADLDEVFEKQHIAHLAKCVLDFLPVNRQAVRGKPEAILRRYVRTFRTAEGQVPCESHQEIILRTMFRDARKHQLFEKLVEHDYAIRYTLPDGTHCYALNPRMYLSDPGIFMLQ